MARKTDASCSLRSGSRFSDCRQNEIEPSRSATGWRCNVFTPSPKASVHPNPPIPVQCLVDEGKHRGLECISILPELSTTAPVRVPSTAAPADTGLSLAMQGPDFKSQFVDPAPASNADLGRTIAQLMQLDVSDKGKFVGRVLSEALPNGALHAVTAAP